MGIVEEREKYISRDDVVVVVVVGAVARGYGPVNPGVGETPRNTGAHPLA